MRTRRQTKVEEEVKVNKTKKSKAEILKEKNQSKKAVQSKQEVEKKVKQSRSKSVARVPSPQPVKKGRGRKAKQTRVKPSPEKPLSKNLEALLDKQDKKQKTKKQKTRSKPQKDKSLSPEAKRVVKETEDEEKQKVKTIVMKGKVPIDDYFPLDKKQFHVLEHQGKVYSATLNQTNIKNNNNKFYVIQVLQSDTNSNNCYFFTRWGRVGVPGQNSNIGPMNIIGAIYQFDDKYRSKTRPGGGYKEIDLNYEEDEEDQKKQKKDEEKSDASKKQSQPKVESSLPKETQSLIELIFDINMMNRQMKEIGYNVKKMPLGKLSKDSIKKGYGILKELYEELKDGKKVSRTVVEDLSSQFYTYIPHDFGFSHMSAHILDRTDKVKSKIEMLQTLSEIKVATKLLGQSDQESEKMSRIDQNYKKLDRDLQPIDPLSTQFEIVEKYMQTTHGRHHTSYKLELVDLFALESERQTVRYTKDIPNKMLLWHGSRLTNYVGILSQGLRIAPPEAPVTGYMFGKGVYFADMCSKSANYCFTNRQSNTGILLLCEVALGDMNLKTHADPYAANLPPGKSSTKGVGRITPLAANEIQLEKGVNIPMGPGVESDDPNLYLRYNEFIVYDVAQIKMKYLLRTKFHYQ